MFVVVFQSFQGGKFSLDVVGSEDLVHHILIVVGRGGVHVLVLVGWGGVVGIGVGEVGIGHSKDSIFR